MASTSAQSKSRKVPRGQTVIHIFALLYLSFKLVRKVNEKVEELSQTESKKKCGKETLEVSDRMKVGV